MSYATWQEALEALVKKEGLEGSELGRLSAEASGTGSPNSNGTVGAPGLSTADLDPMDRRRTVASSTPERGSNTYQGQLSDILSRWREGEGDEYILMVSFDSPTAQRLAERLYGLRGSLDMDGAESSVTIVIGEPPTT